MTAWQKPVERDAVRTAVRFPLRLALHLKTEDGMIEATTKDVSSNGLLFVAANLPKIGSSIEFTMDMPSEVMGSTDRCFRPLHRTGRSPSAFGR